MTEEKPDQTIVRYPMSSRRLLTWLVAGSLSVLVVVACCVEWGVRARSLREEHARRVDRFAATLESRLNDYDVALEMARGLFAASKSVERHEWRAFVKGRTLFDRLPGAIGMAYIQRVPDGRLGEFLDTTRADGAEGFEIFDWSADAHDSRSYDEHAVVRFIEPTAPNTAWLGFNAASLRPAANAMQESTRTNKPVVSGCHRLFDRNGKGVVVYFPVYAKDQPIETPRQRLDAVTGWISVPMSLQRVGNHAWMAPWEDLDLAIVGSADVDPTRLLFASETIASDPDRLTALDSRATHVTDINALGRVWTVVGTDPDTKTAALVIPVLLVAVAGSVIGGLLTLLTWKLAGTRDRAQQLADEATRSLRVSEERYALAVQGSHDGLWDWDLKTNKIYYAPRWKQLLGLEGRDIGDSTDEWFGRIASRELSRFHADLQDHIRGKTDRFDREVEMTHEDGTTRWMLCRAAAVRDEKGEAVRLAGSLADITELKSAQERLRKMAQHDRLTDLPNRELFTDRLRGALSRCKRQPGYHCAVLFFDFDRFKVINDSLGHNVGDALLLSIAERFRKHLRDVDTAARFGGDEFVVLLDGIRGIDEAEEISDRLVQVFAEPHDIDGHEVVSTASIGVVGSDLGYEEAEDMLRDADVAMYQAKSDGKSRFQLFDTNMHDRALARLNLEQDLRRCPFEDEFCLLYQPIVSLTSGELVGFEALVRWSHPQRGIVQPDLFISIAEETGLIVPLGEWVLREACRQLHRWRTHVGQDRQLFVNVNVSKRQLVHPDLPGMIKQVLRDTGVEVADLKIEITETTVMDDRHDMIPVMQRLRGMGIRLAMDDFGTGHSSLSCLHRFPIDVLKIDRGFVLNMEENREFTAVMHAIVSLAHHLDLDVVAEGIETEGQLAQLQAMDCSYAQGYIFAKPLNADDATEYLLSGKRLSKSA